MADIARIPVSESLAMADLAAGFYEDDPVIGYLLGKKNGFVQRRLVLRNCIVTSDAAQTIYSTESRKAFVHAVKPGSWDENLHQFILRGTMKIPFVIDSDAIDRLCDYRDSCKAAVPREGSVHIAAVYYAEGFGYLASEILSSVAERSGGCYSVVHTDEQYEIFERSGFSCVREFLFHDIPCKVMFRAD